jgi:hypothetical protein
MEAAEKLGEMRTRGFSGHDDEVLFGDLAMWTLDVCLQISTRGAFAT